MDFTDSIIVDGVPVRPPVTLAVRNFLDPEVHHFTGPRPRRGPVTEVVVHETVTTSVEATIRALKRRNLGVHFIVGPDGEVTQHGDPVADRLSHAGPHNEFSVGIETITPYYPEFLKPGQPWCRVIDAPWAHRKRYALPSPEQAEATAQLLAWLTHPKTPGLDIPRQWVTVEDDHLSMGRVPGAHRPKPGILPHMAFGHADGPWLVLYAWLRLEAGLSPCFAYEKAAQLATGARRFVNLPAVNAGETLEEV
jgi:hypothetical protein